MKYKKQKKYFRMLEADALNDMEENPANLTSYYSPYRILLDLYEREHEYGKLADIWKRIQAYYPNDPNVKANIEKYNKLAINSSTIRDSIRTEKK